MTTKEFVSVEILKATQKSLLLK